MPFNPNIHHRRSTRLKGYDYSEDGLYFITICVQDMLCLFGYIGTHHNDDWIHRVGTRDNVVGTRNNDVGTRDRVSLHHGSNHVLQNESSQHDVTHNDLSLPQMILNDVGKIANEYWIEIPKHFPNASIHEYIVMPNHMHGIIELVNDSPDDFDVGTRDRVSLHQNHDVSLPNEVFQPLNHNQFGKPIIGSISVIINQYKSSVKRWCNKNGHEYFKWQSRFHDHIIRDEQSYRIISNYITNNPAKWNLDKFYMDTP